MITSNSQVSDTYSEAKLFLYRNRFVGDDENRYSKIAFVVAVKFSFRMVV